MRAVSSAIRPVTAGYSFQKLKTTILVDTESLAIMDAHFMTKKAYDGHIGLQVFRRSAERPAGTSREQDVLAGRTP
jgi:IS5 family transposase